MATRSSRSARPPTQAHCKSKPSALSKHGQGIGGFRESLRALLQPRGSWRLTNDANPSPPMDRHVSGQTAFSGHLFWSFRPPIGRNRPLPAQTRQGKNTAQTGEEFRLYTPGSGHYIDDRGENLVHWLSRFGQRCPDLASGVHFWPAVSIFGQPCPRGVIVHPLGGPPRTAMGVEVRNTFRKVREQPTPRPEALPRGACRRS